MQISDGTFHQFETAKDLAEHLAKAGVVAINME